MLGKAGLNVTTNGILLDSFLLDVSRALLCGIILSWQSNHILSANHSAGFRSWYLLKKLVITTVLFQCHFN